jgi:SAM-dependent methyltransferase
MSPPIRSIPNTAATNADFEFAGLQEAGNYRRALAHTFRIYLHGRVVEIGAGIGQMTREFRALPEVTEIVAVEPEARFVAQLEMFLPQSAIIHGVSTDVPASPGWDALVSINVLEHIERDQEELQRFHQLLASKRGHLCLFVPARPEIYAPLDRDFGHFRRYTRPELRAKLKAAGFTVEKLYYYNLPGYFAWWLSFCILRRRGFSVTAVRFFDRFIFPLSFWIESRLCAPPFGQNLVAIARASTEVQNRTE